MKWAPKTSEKFIRPRWTNNTIQKSSEFVNSKQNLSFYGSRRFKVLLFSMSIGNAMLSIPHLYSFIATLDRNTHIKLGRSDETEGWGSIFSRHLHHDFSTTILYSGRPCKSQFHSPLFLLKLILFFKKASSLERRCCREGPSCRGEGRAPEGRVGSCSSQCQVRCLSRTRLATCGPATFWFKPERHVIQSLNHGP